MIKLNDLSIALPDTWSICPFDPIIIGSKTDGLGRLQILLGRKSIFEDFPSHEQCVALALDSFRKEGLPDDPADIFQGSHDECCLLGALIYSDEEAFERIYYKYTDQKFITAGYRVEGDISNLDTDTIDKEMDDCDYIIESIRFDCDC